MAASQIANIYKDAYIDVINFRHKKSFDTIYVQLYHMEALICKNKSWPTSKSRISTKMDILVFR